MDCRDIITAKLRKLGADGLVNCEAECGCSIDAIAPCENSCLDCSPAVRRKADKDGSSYRRGDYAYFPMKG